MKREFFSMAGTILVLILVLNGCTSKKVQVLLEPSVALGTVLAEEAMQAAGPKKQIGIITPDANWGPSSTVEQTFRSMLQQKGYSAVTAKSANLGDPMHMSTVGLMAPDFAEALEKSADAGAVVSFAGAPQFWQSLGGRLNSSHPPVFVVATAMLGAVPGLPTDHGQLQSMANAGVIQVAIVDGGEALPADAKPSELHSVFAQNFSQIRKAQ
jgi:hypothetical protein